MDGPASVLSAAVWGPWAWAGALYAALALDSIAVGQFMVSRPLVVGPLLGAALGDASLGLAVGMVVELLWINVIPVGVWPIDTAGVAALGVGWALASAEPGRPALVLALALAIPAGILIRAIDVRFRSAARHVTPWVAKALKEGKEGALSRAVVLGVALTWLKSWTVFVALGAAGLPLLNAVLARCSARMQAALDFSGQILPLVALAVALNHFLSRGKGKGGLPWHLPAPGS
jgi:mannose/fructose/N-acetylgalactosamine-specific phosphotransferase system component IIC